MLRQNFPWRLISGLFKISLVEVLILKRELLVLYLGVKQNYKWGNEAADPVR